MPLNFIFPLNKNRIAIWRRGSFKNCAPLCMQMHTVQLKILPHNFLCSMFSRPCLPRAVFFLMRRNSTWNVYAFAYIMWRAIFAKICATLHLRYLFPHVVLVFQKGYEWTNPTWLRSEGEFLLSRAKIRLFWGCLEAFWGAAEAWPATMMIALYLIQQVMKIVNNGDGKRCCLLAVVKESTFTAQKWNHKLSCLVLFSTVCIVRLHRELL